MISLRHKLAFGFGGLLAIIAVMALLTVQQIDRLGNAIDVMLRQNYRSVQASQAMKESLENIDRDILYSFTGRHEVAPHNIRESEQRFRYALSVELGNITLPGEKEKAERIEKLFSRFVVTLHDVESQAIPVEKRREAYFSSLLPLLSEISSLAQQILDMNQANMDRANAEARMLASSARTRILIATVACALVAVMFSFQSRKWILRPIARLIDSAKEIRSGNLDLVIDPESRDEIGQLSEAFNEMAATLRLSRRKEDEKLHRSRRATQEVMNMLPTAIAIFDPEGRIDVATQSAIRSFGLTPGSTARELGYAWLPELLHQAAVSGRPVEGENGYIQKFIDNREYFFRPAAAPIPPLPDATGITGTVLLLQDMTQAHEQKELKQGVVATVSHQLRTPLTSLRMAIHLLLEERIGTLNTQQLELLQAAGEESDRLAAILDDLLDLNRIESGRARLKMQELRPEAIVHAGMAPFAAEAKDRGVALQAEVPAGLPTVSADASSLGHVFANLLSNALRYSRPGGTITVKAEAELSGIRFSVSDTGEGIAPEYLKHLFDQFFRVPGQDESSGIGLGLSIVREIITAHAGTVGVESTLGRGSTFHFTLPA